MKFTPKHFDPSGQRLVAEPVSHPVPGGASYIYEPSTTLAVNVALSVGRPLLVSGEPGSGKTTLARSIAAVLGWRFYKAVITSRTQARDLEWNFDAVRRLGDAQANRLNPNEAHYIEPRILWWAFAPDTAEFRGTANLPVEARARDPRIAGSGRHAVVLLDEIDKADPDVPNDLLEPLDVGKFSVEELTEVDRGGRQVLVVITTNGERELPPAFVRRCISLDLAPPGEAWLQRIARERFPKLPGPVRDGVTREILGIREKLAGVSTRKPGTAEFIDALTVCEHLMDGRAADEWFRSEEWQCAVRATLAKQAASLTPGA
jgi:MoxR-like ATPase